MVAKALFSSASDEWATPQDLFNKLNQEFGFTLDVCATPENAKCARFFTKEQDAMGQVWGPGERIFMNPPYSEIADWMHAAFMAASTEGSTVVCLVPSRTCTRWWHEYAEPILRGTHGSVDGEVRFIKGRLKFGNSRNSAPFPSAIVVMRPRKP